MRKNSSSIVLVLALALVNVPAAHAFSFSDYWPFKKNTKAAHVRRNQRLPGQEVKNFKLKNVKVDDVVEPLQSYLDGIKSDGDLFANPAENVLVATDFPENLAKLGAIVKEIDQVYDNPNAMARQMLITKNMLKAIRTISGNGGVAVATRRASVLGALADKAAAASSAPGAAPVFAPGMRGPANVPTFGPWSGRRDIDDDAVARTPWRVITTSPLLSTYQMVGWMRDEDGILVVLSNQGERFFYRRGKIHPGFLRAKPLEGLEGRVEQQRLILRDVRQGQVSINLQKRPDL